MTRLFSILLFSYRQLTLNSCNTLDHRGSGRLSIEASPDVSSLMDHRGSGRLQFQGPTLAEMSWQLA
ncbi:MAG: hypothetical protein AAGF01_05380 [Cyanobacteria bacterium P01_G01_bin.38]